ncbi:MAG: NUDIX domain-containing protein [Elioraea sp.]|nr:NUDIX domain-containing protein [Elioraea sp.]MDW8445294.1 NUDIX domain-containing protein [Acetobacteraceae bacterium]
MADLSFPPHPAVAIEAVETVWRGRTALQRVRYSLMGFDGRRVGPATWEVVRRGRAVAVLPHDPRTRRVVLIEQFRLPALAAGLDPMLIEAAAGLVDGEEDEEAAARRETLEETGLVVEALERVGRFILTPGIADETIAIFLAETAIPAPPADGILRLTGMAHEHEHIRVLAVSEDDAFAWLDAGRIVNATTAIALQALRLRRLREEAAR